LCHSAELFVEFHVQTIAFEVPLAASLAFAFTFCHLLQCFLSSTNDVYARSWHVFLVEIQVSRLEFVFGFQKIMESLLFAFHHVTKNILFLIRSRAPAAFGKHFLRISMLKRSRQSSHHRRL